MSSNDVKDEVNAEAAQEVALTPVQQAYKAATAAFAAEHGTRLADVTTMLRALDQVLQKLLSFAGEPSMPDVARYIIGSTLAQQADAVTRDLYFALSAWNQGEGEVDQAKVTEFFRIQAESRKTFKAIEQRFTPAANDDPAGTLGDDSGLDSAVEGPAIILSGGTTL